MPTNATQPRTDSQPATFPRRKALLAGAAIALAVGFGIGRWQMSGHHAGSAASTTRIPAVVTTVVAPAGAAVTGATPVSFSLEAFPNGCPCDLATLPEPASAPVATSVSFPLEAFPNGCPCDLSTLGLPVPPR